MRILNESDVKVYQFIKIHGVEKIKREMPGLYETLTKQGWILANDEVTREKKWYRQAPNSI